MFKKSLYAFICAVSIMHASAITELKTMASFTAALQNHEMVVVDFFMNNCGPCKVIAPLLDQLARQLPTIPFFKVNIEILDSLTSSYRIRGVPCVVFFKNGVEVGRHVGCNAQTTVDSINKKITSAFGI